MQWTKIKPRNYDLFSYEGEGKLLDYGCASGGYLSLTHDRGWHVTGMDMSEHAVSICRKKGFEAHVGIRPDKQFEPNTFDVVTMWHVFEHVLSPTETLEQIKRVLKPNGRVILALPNIGSKPAQWFGIYWFALDLPRHLTHFSSTTLTKLFEKNGYKVEKIFSQRHGQTVQASFRYIGREENSALCRLLSKSKRLGAFLQGMTRLIGEPAQIVVHARKID